MQSKVELYHSIKAKQQQVIIFDNKLGTYYVIKILARITIKLDVI